MSVTRIVTGDLLDQPVDSIVNAWNRNFIPWWLLLPQGVSGAIKRRGGYAPFRELRQYGLLQPGQAVLTSAGRLPFKSIIHVAALNVWWRSSAAIVSAGARNALLVAQREQYSSVAVPLLGSGTGGVSPDLARQLILEEAAGCSFAGEVVIVEYPGARG